MEYKENKIQDSGNRIKFKSGAVRDIQEGKGRCDLMPLDKLGRYYEWLGETANNDFEESKLLSEIFDSLGKWEYLKKESCLYFVMDCFEELQYGNGRNRWESTEDMILDVAKHYEQGAKKYGENNWKKGIPYHSYLDSAVRHLLKFVRGDEDERHDRAFIWNILSLLWTMENKTELDDVKIKKFTEIKEDEQFK